MSCSCVIVSCLFIVHVILFPFSDAAIPVTRPATQYLKVNEDVGSPLFLTPFILNGSIEYARTAAKVEEPPFQDAISYTGFLTVNTTYDKNLFIWFCPSQSDFLNDPVVLWLQGGPGGSSLFGLLAENGPFKLQKDFTIEPNEYSWSKTHSVLYIDNPAGTGYSFTKEGGLNHDETQIAEELFEALQQFFTLFPELRKNEFFITGESYAGKYVPAVSHTILMKNSNLKDARKINLKGMAIGNGITDPVNQLDLGEYAYQHGLVDLKTKNVMNDYKKRITDFIDQGRYADATLENLQFIQTFKNASGFTNMYNYLYPLLKDDEDLVAAFVQKNNVRKLIHVGNSTHNDGNDVSRALREDIMKSMTDILPPLLENYRVLFYNGQLDMRLPYPCMVNYLQKLNFSSADEYKTADRVIWHVNEDIAGYAKVAGNMTELLVRNAGHLMPTDQPEWALDMITKFTRNVPFQ